MNIFQRFILKTVLLFYPHKFYGLENTNVDGGALIIGNHFHALDFIFVMDRYRKESLKIVGKKELFKNKLLAKILIWLGGIPLDRENADIKTVVAIMKAIKSGEKVLIYPEGTRNKTGSTELLPIKGESLIFAIKSKSPIIPAMLVKKPKIFRKTNIIFGKPFYLDEFYNKKITEEDLKRIEQITADKMNEARNELKNLLDKNNKVKNGNIASKA